MNNYSSDYSKVLSIYSEYLSYINSQIKMLLSQNNQKHQLKAKFEWQMNMETPPAARTNTHKHEISFQYQVLQNIFFSFFNSLWLLM